MTAVEQDFRPPSVASYLQWDQTLISPESTKPFLDAVETRSASAEHVTDGIIDTRISLHRCVNCNRPIEHIGQKYCGRRDCDDAAANIAR